MPSSPVNRGWNDSATLGVPRRPRAVAHFTSANGSCCTACVAWCVDLRLARDASGEQQLATAKVRQRHEQEVREHGLEQWRSAFDLVRRGIGRVVREERAEPSAYTDGALGEGSFFIEEAGRGDIPERPGRLIERARSDMPDCADCDVNAGRLKEAIPTLKAPSTSVRTDA